MDEYNHSIQRLVSYFLDQLRTVNYHHMQQRENLEQRVALEGAGNAAKETALDAMTAQFERAKGVITAQRATIGKLCNELEEQQVLNHDELGKEAGRGGSQAEVGAADQRPAQRHYSKGDCNECNDCTV